MNEPEYTLAWAQLCEWVLWFSSRYRLALEDRLPGCWPRHPELIEELWALRTWRAEAYGPDGTGQAAVYWHQALVTFLTHTATWWAAGCRAGHKSPATDIEHGYMISDADPLAGIPRALRPPASVPTDPATDEGLITMPTLEVITEAQMRALIDAGTAHPQLETVAAFTYYDGSWWVHASPTSRDAHTEPEERGIWLRADDDDLAFDPTFRQQLHTPR